MAVERRSPGAERQRRLRERRAAAGVPGLEEVRRAVCGALATMVTSDPTLAPAAAGRIAELAVSALIADGAARRAARAAVLRVMTGRDRRQAPPDEEAELGPS